MTQAEFKLQAGYIYILLNDAGYTKDGRPLYKIGYTTNAVELRAAALSDATGIASPFKILKQYKTVHSHKVEKRIHKRLNKYRWNPAREFFFCTLDVAIDAINKELI